MSADARFSGDHDVAIGPFVITRQIQRARIGNRACDEDVEGVAVE